MAHQLPGGVNRTQLKVYLETQENSDGIFQNFRLVSSNDKFLQYFTDERYLGYKALETEISKYYAGDGEKILFRKKVYYNNLVTVIFDKIDKDAKIREEIKNAQFEIETSIPAFAGCIYCEHFRKNIKLCMYYQVILPKLKTNCIDFQQKEVKHGEKEKEDTNG